MSAVGSEQSEFSGTRDINDGKPLGVGWPQLTIAQGERCSAATAYLGRYVLDRPNLHVVVDTLAMRVLGKRQGGEVVVNEVELVSQGSDLTQTRRKVVRASREIILSAGSVGSPSILLQSGIGPRPHHAASIKPIPWQIDLPDAGRHLSDHPLFSFIWRTNCNDTFEAYNQNSTYLYELLG